MLPLECLRELATMVCGLSDLDPDVIDRVKKAKRTKRGIHCKDLFELAREIVEKRERERENLCVLALTFYLERAPRLIDCAMRRPIRLGIGEYVSEPETPSLERLSLSLIECIDEEVSTLNLLRRASPCDFLQVTAFLKSTASRRSEKRAIGRVEAIVRECYPICANEEQRALLEDVRKKLAEEGDRVIEALKKLSLHVAELLCRELPAKLGPVFCKSAG